VFLIDNLKTLRLFCQPLNVHRINKRTKLKIFTSEMVLCSAGEFLMRIAQKKSQMKVIDPKR
jgi:hypothetical protein